MNRSLLIAAALAMGLLFIALSAPVDHICAEDAPAGGGATRVTVVLILASRDCKTIDPKLTEVAKEIQKRDPSFTGFKLHNVLLKSIQPGDSHTFTMMDEEKLTVTVSKQKNAGDRATLTLSMPGVEKVCYSCTCNRYITMISNHKTQTGEALIVAVMAKPCTGKGP